jgi:hypothetical protein
VGVGPQGRHPSVLHVVHETIKVFPCSAIDAPHLALGVISRLANASYAGPKIQLFFSRLASGIKKVLIPVARHAPLRTYVLNDYFYQHLRRTITQRHPPDQLEVILSRASRPAFRDSGYFQSDCFWSLSNDFRFVGGIQEFARPSLLPKVITQHKLTLTDQLAPGGFDQIAVDLAAPLGIDADLQQLIFQDVSVTFGSQGNSAPHRQCRDDKGEHQKADRYSHGCYSHGFCWGFYGKIPCYVDVWAITFAINLGQSLHSQKGVPSNCGSAPPNTEVNRTIMRP